MNFSSAELAPLTIVRGDSNNVLVRKIHPRAGYLFAKEKNKKATS